MSAHGVMFHHFHDDGDWRDSERRHAPTQGSISAADLDAIVHGIGLENILPAAEWRERALADALPEHAVCLTFDDTLKCQYDLARPVLERYGLTGFFMISTGAWDGTVGRVEVHRRLRDRCFESIESFHAAFFKAAQRCPFAERVTAAQENELARAYLSEFSFYSTSDRVFRFVRDQVLTRLEFDAVMSALMADRGVSESSLTQDLWMDPSDVSALAATGHVIGLHTHTHPTAVARLPVEEQFREYETNRDQLALLLGSAPDVMAHPCNSYSDATLSLLEDLGVRLGFRAHRRGDEHRRLAMPREDHCHLLKKTCA